MKKAQKTLRNEDTIKESILYIAFELSNSKWKLAFSDGNKVRYKTISAGDLAQLQTEIKLAKEKFGYFTATWEPAKLPLSKVFANIWEV